jgi:enoyl-CoA hydratase/carnithine racemase
MSAVQRPDSLKVEQNGNLLLVFLTRPAKRNALNDETMFGLEQIFSTLPASVGAVVLAGEGAHFSAGLDLAELRERDALEGVQHSRMWHRVIEKLQFAPVPVVAALQGAVVGGGLELAAAAHIRVAEPSTFYALPEGQRGIFVGGGASVNVARLIGVARMMDMMLTGRVVKAEEGITIGLAHYLVGAGEGLGKATELASKIASNAPATNYAITHVLPRIAEVGQDAGLLMEALIAGITQSTPEAKTRVQQFLDKKAKKVTE